MPLALGQRRNTDGAAPARPGAPVYAPAEEPQLVVGRVAVAARTAVVERRGGALELLDGLVSPAGLRQGAAGEQARERGLDRRADMSAAPAEASARSAASGASPDARATTAAALSAIAVASASGPIEIAVRSAQAAARAASSGRPNASQQRASNSSHFARKLPPGIDGSSGPPVRVEEQLDGVFEARVAGLEPRRRKRQAGGRRYEPVVHLARELDALLGRPKREFGVTGLQSGERTIEQQPGQALRVAEQPRFLDGRVEHLATLREPALQHSRPREQHEREDGDRRLSARSGDGHHALGVDAGFLEAVDVELRAREVDRGVQPRRHLVIGKRVHESRGLRACSSCASETCPHRPDPQARAATALAVSASSPSRRATPTARFAQPPICSNAIR